MKKEEFYYKSADKETMIHAVRWIPEEEPKAIIQISHGVTEYILRYEELAQYLTKRGYLVIGNDDLGHGDSINKYPMYFGPEGSWFIASSDIHTCLVLSKEKYNHLPCYILGFSLGSFLARTNLINYPEDYDGTILLGTGQQSKLAISLGLIMAKKMAKKMGDTKTGEEIDNLTYDSYNKKFTPIKTKFDWLCANEDAIEEYMNDKKRGDSFTAGLFRELLLGMKYAGDNSNISKMRKDIPILLLSGEQDPVGEFGKGVIRLNKKFNKMGINDVSMKLYPNMRHDILHEKEYQKVYTDIDYWLKDKIK